MMSTSRNMYPFTVSQWRELELQALIFKYMVSGMAIPPDLLHNINRNLDFSLSSTYFLQKPEHSMGFNCFQVGFGKKIDPEPGRCRRTDGKKWRCSKEAFQESKYCERHMHRGRNRSRKPVENMSTTSSTTTTLAASNNTPTAIPIASLGRNSEHSVSSFPYAYPHSLKDYGYGQGMKEDMSGHNFFSDVSGTMRSTVSGASSVDDSWYQKMNSNMGHLNQKEISFSQSGHNNSSYLKLQNFEEASGQQRQQHHQSKQAMHHFIDESPPKDKDFWFGSEDKLRSNDVSFSNTNLSISMPSSEHDFFITRNN